MPGGGAIPGGGGRMPIGGGAPGGGGRIIIIPGGRFGGPPGGGAIIGGGAWRPRGIWKTNKQKKKHAQQGGTKMIKLSVFVVVVGNAEMGKVQNKQKTCHKLSRTLTTKVISEKVNPIPTVDVGWKIVFFCKRPVHWQKKLTSLRQEKNTNLRPSYRQEDHEEDQADVQVDHQELQQNSNKEKE